MKIEIIHDMESKRFSAMDEEGTELGYLMYSVKNNTMDIEHTVVLKEHRGKGIGSNLVDAACDYSVKSGYVLISTCSFANKKQ